MRYFNTISPVLWHGSPRFIKDYIEPEGSITCTGEKGAFVYASPCLQTAISHSMKIRSGSLAVINYNQYSPICLLVQIPFSPDDDVLERVLQLKPYVYKVPTDQFRCITDKKGMPTGKWISTKEVKYIEGYEVSPVSFLISGDVQLFTVNPLCLVKKTENDNTFFDIGSSLKKRLKTFGRRPRSLTELCIHGEIIWQNLGVFGEKSVPEHTQKILAIDNLTSFKELLNKLSGAARPLAHGYRKTLAHCCKI